MTEGVRRLKRSGVEKGSHGSGHIRRTHSESVRSLFKPTLKSSLFKER